MGCFLLALWRKQVQLMMLFIYACIHSPSFTKTFRFLVKFRQLKALKDAASLKVGSMEMESERGKEDCNNASMRHQCSLTFLGHQIIHRERKHKSSPAGWKYLTWYLYKRIKPYQASNTSVPNYKLTGKQVHFTFLFKELPRISQQPWMDYAETEASKAAKGGSGHTESTTSHELTLHDVLYTTPTSKTKRFWSHKT